MVSVRVGGPTALANIVQHCRDRWCRPILHGLRDFLSSSLTKSYLSNFSQNFLEQPCLRSWGTLTQTESTTCTVPSAPEYWRSFLSAGRMENLGSCWSQGTSVFPNQINHVFITESLCHIRKTNCPRNHLQRHWALSGSQRLSVIPRPAGTPVPLFWWSIKCPSTGTVPVTLHSPVNDSGLSDVKTRLGAEQFSGPGGPFQPGRGQFPPRNSTVLRQRPFPLKYRLFPALDPCRSSLPCLGRASSGLCIVGLSLPFGSLLRTHFQRCPPQAPM